jgi:hypothetical protein
VKYTVGVQVVVEEIYEIEAENDEQAAAIAKARAAKELPFSIRPIRVNVWAEDEAGGEL